VLDGVQRGAGQRTQLAQEVGSGPAVGVQGMMTGMPKMIADFGQAAWWRFTKLAPASLAAEESRPCGSGRASDACCGRHR